MENVVDGKYNTVTFLDLSDIPDEEMTFYEMFGQKLGYGWTVGFIYHAMLCDAAKRSNSQDEFKEMFLYESLENRKLLQRVYNEILEGNEFPEFWL